MCGSVRRFTCLRTKASHKPRCFYAFWLYFRDSGFQVLDDTNPRLSKPRAGGSISGLVPAQDLALRTVRTWSCTLSVA